jgi:hypothetical protein
MTNPISNPNLKSACRRFCCLLLLDFLQSLLLQVFAEGRQAASTNFMGVFFCSFKIKPHKNTKSVAYVRVPVEVAFYF